MMGVYVTSMWMEDNAVTEIKVYFENDTSIHILP
jgi:hypothetical protein